jgi:cathepsin L
MKLEILVFTLLATALSSARINYQLTSDDRDNWHTFKITYNKTYTELEEPRRQDIWMSNSRYVQKFNQKNNVHEIELNELADLTPAEYSRINGFKRSYGDSLAKPHAGMFQAPLNSNIPRSVDWRQHGYVTPVKNQGMCGSCWAFSTTGSLEGQHARAGKLVSLSEQNLVDCSTSYGNHGCNGGLMDQAFQYIKDNQGIDLEEGYPYEAKDDVCRFSSEKLGATDVGFVDIPQGDEVALKEAVATVGPVSVAIDASHKSFQMYKKGVYVEPECSPTALDHGVLVVGYGVSDDGQDYWLVKNLGTQVGRGRLYSHGAQQEQSVRNCILSELSFNLIWQFLIIGKNE